jgi:hypothetical protein
VGKMHKVRYPLQSVARRESGIESRLRTVFLFPYEFVIVRNNGIIVMYNIVNEKDSKAYWEREKKEHGK